MSSGKVSQASRSRYQTPTSRKMSTRRPEWQFGTQGKRVPRLSSVLELTLESGTTGYPKGVMATIGRYYSRLAAQFTQMGIKPLRKDGSGDRWYICMPMVHSTAGSAVLICMLMPTTLCIGFVTGFVRWSFKLTCHRKRFSASRFWDEVRRSRSTMGTYVGEIARYLLALPPSPLDRQHCLRMMYGNG